MGKLRTSGKEFHSILYTVLGFAVVFSFLFVTVTAGAEENGKKQKVVVQVAKKWIDVGIEQYNEGFYKAAEQSFLRAQDYKEYLSDSDRAELADWIDKTSNAANARKTILGDIELAESLAEQGRLAEAKVAYEKVSENEFLTKPEWERVEAGLNAVNEAMSGQKGEIADLYAKSVEFYNQGELEKAREGFLQVAKSDLVAAEEGKTAEDYLVKIDEALAGQTQMETTDAETTGVEEGSEWVAVEDQVIQVIEDENEVEVEAASQGAPVPQQEEFIQEIQRKRNVLRSHTLAVVNDAFEKANQYMAEGDYDNAIKAVEEAERVVNQNQLHLGEELYTDYDTQLNQLSQTVAERKVEYETELAAQRESEAITAQESYRAEMAADRASRIVELMTNARSYLKQQRYEEALGQLESLLSLDPLHDEALVLKQTIEDTISFREQLDVVRQSRKEQTNLMIETERTGIPYADEIVYPKNWREKIAKRKGAEAIGQDPRDKAVYDQLATVVDLSELSPDMGFASAIELIKNKVEPPLKIIVRWRDLYDNAEVDQTTQINMDPLRDVPLGTALKILLQSVSGGLAEIGYVVNDGIITIATTGSLPSEMVTLVYDVSELVSPEANFVFETSDIQQLDEDVSGMSSNTSDQDELLGTDQLEVKTEGIIYLIQESVDPESWFAGDGGASIRIFASRRLVITQTLDNHRKIETLINDLRKTLDQQVAIEARFLTVTESFLEDIGIDLDITYVPGGKMRSVVFEQGSSDTTAQNAIASTLSTGYGSVLDDLQVDFLLRATQQHQSGKTINAPKVTVLSGEAATLSVVQSRAYIADYDFEDVSSVTSGTQGTDVLRVVADPEIEEVAFGAVLNVTPIVTADRKYVLLRITASLSNADLIQVPIPSGSGDQTFPIDFPQRNITTVQTRVAVPDGGTLLIGGQKITDRNEIEEGVPGLGKIPIIGTLFNNRSENKTHSILLILVKPTIMLKNETEEEHIASLESAF